MINPFSTKPGYSGYWRSIQGNLVLLLLFMLVPVILIQAYLYHDQTRTRRAEELQTNLEVARAVANNFESFVQDIIHSELVIGLALTTSPPISDGDRDRILGAFAADNPSVRAVFWVNQAGIIAASSRKNYIGFDVSDRSYFREIESGREWYVGELIQGKATGRLGCSIVRGIRDERGALYGIVAVSFEPSGLAGVLGIDRSEDAGVSLIDQKGMHVHRYPATEYTWEQRNWLKFYPRMQEALEGHEVTTTVVSELTGKKRFVGFAPVPSIGWVAAASRAESEAMAAISSALMRQTWLFSIVTLGVFCAAFLLSRFISAPVAQLREQALRFSREGEVIPVVDSGPIEVKELSHVLHEMAERVRSHKIDLEESRERYRNIFDNVSEGIFQTTPDGRYMSVNSALARMFGYGSPAEMAATVTNIGAEVYVNPEDRERLITMMRSSGGAVSGFEAQVRRKDGSVFWISINATPIRDHHGDTGAYTGTCMDITERKLAEAERAKLERRLQQARKAESLGRMAGAIAHHFNNKLAVVLGNLELTANHTRAGSDLSNHLLEAKMATIQAAEVSGLMLAYLGQEAPRAETFDLAGVCREVIGAQKPMLPQRVAMNTEITSDAVIIRAGHAQVRQVLSNLIINAREAIAENQEGEICVSLRTVTALETSSPNIFPSDWKPAMDTYACLEVSDNGCGIDPGELDLIFDPFYSTKFQGRGLGLPVVLGTVRSHGGAIGVESAPGRGSTFRVLWPVEKDAERPLAAQQTDAPAPFEGSGLILFVDDEPQLRNMAEAMLSLLGFKVIKACQGMEAVEIFRNHRDEICLVILDLTMPGMSGWETLEALRALRPDLPVILASGYDETMAMEGKHTDLPQAFLHKPYGMADLRTAIAAAVKR